MKHQRREFLKLMGVGGAFTLLPISITRAAAPTSIEDRAHYISASAGDHDDFYVSAFNANGKILFEQALPGRGHDLGLRPNHVDVAAVERRPGLYGLILDRHSGEVRAKLHCPEDRRFYGHAVYSDDGRFLYITENDFDHARGVVSVWDAEDGYRRIAEFDSFGTGPHELHLMPDGESLVIANGGLHTHPDFDGRTALNIDSMEPNLSIIDRHTGKLIHQAALKADWHQLSIRHLDVAPNGTIAAGFQYQGELTDQVPLVGLWQPGSEIRPIEAPDNVQLRMRQYCGSVRFDASGQVFGISCPRGGLITFWDVKTSGFLTHIAAPDGCGLAATDVAGQFVGTSGLGNGWRMDAIRRKRVELPDDSLKSLHWDNHLRRISI
ncbi:DUF1513 domain-containing protein [Thalassospira xiamenensis]|jgi:hypothetical protein|uniref:DUF1513 domain-containing protein n=1 Tax=Thalassospira xiamenensis TaxID=220697 RepID=A0A367WZK8_9PROT|nr:DUF1513 domain-containing protein [Thalassospira xiamenensis]KZB55561.1 hypothetical protein AUP41_17080 [Thalassospira xiamenensis]RCK46863.1 hypothetical protein TH44_18700 [Thalassospira xiamenensis]